MAVRFGFNWLEAIVPKRILPFVIGEAIGDVALLDESGLLVERGVFDGPGCGLGNDVPKSKEKISFQFNKYKTEIKKENLIFNFFFKFK